MKRVMKPTESALRRMISEVVNETIKNLLKESVKPDNGEDWVVYVNGRKDEFFTDNAKKWKHKPKVGKGCYAGGTVFKIVKIKDNKVYMEKKNN